MNRTEKVALGKEFQTLVKDATGVLVTEYRGLTVEELTQLRVGLMKSGARFKVIKNRVARKALEGTDIEISPLAPQFKGPIGLVVSYKDSAQATKVAFEFEKDHPNFIVKGGYVESDVYAPEQLKAIASLPSKDVLIAQILSTILNPHRGLVTVLSGVSRNLVTVLNAIKDKKNG